VRLSSLGASGLSPSLPTGYSWSLPGARKGVRSEPPQGRRINALATHAPLGPAPRLEAVPRDRTLTSDDRPAYPRGPRPAAGVPGVVARDSAGLHTSKVVKAARPAVTGPGIFPGYLPAYSPALNRIEPVLKHVKPHEVPTRSLATREGLRKAVEEGFDSYRKQLASKSNDEPRLSA
jgi:transposase